MKTHTVLSLLAVSALLPACKTMTGVATARAASDFSCPEDQIQVESIGGTSYKATGCGQSATYDCVQSTVRGFGGPDLVCVPERAASEGGDQERSSKKTSDAAPQSEPPTGAAGFSLDATLESCSSACEKAGNQWTEAGADGYVCSGTASDIGMPATVRVKFVDGKSTSVELVVASSDAKKLLKQMASLREALESKYGEAADSDSKFPAACVKDELPACISDGRAHLLIKWKWATGETINLAAGKPSDAAAAVVAVTYARKAHSAKAKAL